MPKIIPTVTETNSAAFHARIVQLAQFADELHLDFADGVFAPTVLTPLADITWPDNISVDLHVMYQKPVRFIETVLALLPQQVTIHAESEGDLLHLIAELKAAGIAVGVALLPDSPVSMYARLIEHADSVLIFGGKLGYQGGILDESQLAKIPEIRAINSRVELAWDGGINVDNAKHLVAAGIDRLNVGGAISHAHDPKAAFSALSRAIRD